MTADVPGLELRPVRPTDRPRVFEITEEVWGGADYLPEVFDRWVTDPGGQFQAAELEGMLVGIHRVRPVAPGVVLYEGLRVDAAHRRRGLARAMLRQAMEAAAAEGFQEMRVTTGDEVGERLFEGEGFGARARSRRWGASRVEGGDPPRLASPADADRLARMAAGDPSFAAYGGVLAGWQGPLDVDAGLIERMAEDGWVRLGPGGRTFALLLQPGSDRLVVGFIAGAGAALDELLEALRFEADSQGLGGVALWLPESHPAADQIEAVGYHLEDESTRCTAYVRRLM